jgi:hypothetical protein
MSLALKKRLAILNSLGARIFMTCLPKALRHPFLATKVGQVVELNEFD